MSELELNWVMNRMPPSDDRYLEIMSIENVEKARRFHKSFPQYSVTAMANLSKMAKYLAVSMRTTNPTQSSLLLLTLF